MNSFSRCLQSRWQTRPKQTTPDQYRRIHHLSDSPRNSLSNTRSESLDIKQTGLAPALHISDGRIGKMTCRAGEQSLTIGTEGYRTIVQGRNVKLTEALKAFAEEKLTKALNKYESAIKEVDINLSVSGGNRGRGDEKQKCEITIFLYRLGVVRAEDVEENLYAAIEKVTDIVSRKMRKVKEKAISKGKWDGSAGPRGHSAYKELPEEVSLSDNDDVIDLDAPAPSFPPEVIRTKILGLTPTSTEDALEQVEHLGHAFYIFRDKDDKLKVLYKRKFSGYGVIVPQFL